jgi:hypothetical protein
MSGDQDPQNRQRYRQQTKLNKRNPSKQSIATTGSETIKSLPNNPTVSSQLNENPMTTVPPRVNPSSIGATTPQDKNPIQRTNVSYKNMQVGNSVIRVEVKETIRIPMNQIKKLYQTLKTRFEK